MRAALLQWSGFFLPSGEPYDYWHSTSSATRCHWHSDRNAFRLLHDPSRRCFHGHLAQGQSRQQPVGTLRYGHDLRPCQQESGPVRGLRRQWLSERHLGLRRIHVEPGLQPERSLTPRSLGNRLRPLRWTPCPVWWLRWIAIPRRYLDLGWRHRDLGRSNADHAARPCHSAHDVYRSKDRPRRDVRGLRWQPLPVHHLALVWQGLGGRASRDLSVRTRRGDRCQRLRTPYRCPVWRAGGRESNQHVDLGWYELDLAESFYTTGHRLLRPGSVRPSAGRSGDVLGRLRIEHNLGLDRDGLGHRANRRLAAGPRILRNGLRQ